MGGFRTRAAPRERLLLPAAPPWMDKALCRTSGTPAHWFPDDSDTGAIAEAVAVCAECPVRADCLEDAMSVHGLRYGIWGGLTRPQRRALRRKRTAAARTAEAA